MSGAVRISEAVKNNIHTLMVAGAAGRIDIAGRIDEACEAWGFRVAAHAIGPGGVVALTLKAARRAPASIVPPIEGAVRAWGYEVVHPYGPNARARKVLHIKPIEGRAGR